LTLLEARELSYTSPDGRPLGEGLSFSLAAGGLLLVTGPNGTGKTSLLRLILGERGPRLRSGSLRAFVPAREIAVLPQASRASSPVPASLGDVVELLAYPGRPAADAADAAFLARAWNTASGGERQRALLLAVLARRPRLLLLDEPLSHLDQTSRAFIVQTIEDYLLAEPGRAAVVVSHEPDFEALSRVELGRLSVRRAGA
jgi:ABC-type cobalamin/Fe3+-siderophores transport system ATPase subunit